jgi:hypothetical protein
VSAFALAANSSGFPGPREVPFHLLFSNVFLKQHGLLQDNSTVRREYRRDPLVVLTERAFLLVDYLQNSDQSLIHSQQWNRKQGPCYVARLTVNIPVEAGVGIAVGDVNEASFLSCFTGYSFSAGKTDEAGGVASVLSVLSAPLLARDDFGEGGRYLDVEFIGLGIIQEDAGPVGVEDLQGGSDRLLQNLFDTDRGCEVTRRVEDAPQCTGFELGTTTQSGIVHITPIKISGRHGEAGGRRI